MDSRSKGNNNNNQFNSTNHGGYNNNNAQNKYYSNQNKNKCGNYNKMPGNYQKGNNSFYLNQKNNRVETNSNEIPLNHTVNHNEKHYLNNTNIDNYVTELIPVESNGNNPTSRFGHSLVKIDQVKVCLFGGAVGETRKINYSNETYIYNIMTKLWIKLIVNKNYSLPKARAAHAAAANNNSVMMIYGGSTSNGGLADDQIWLLYLHEGNENEGEWKEYPTIGQTPGPRYGHSLIYMDPYFILFGGNFNPNLSNDVWIIDINNKQNSWKKVTFQNNVGPSPRLYHTCGICESGNFKGMMIIYGGRDSNENPLNDIWGLSYNNGVWSWSRGAIVNGDKMKPRYNHSMVFYEDLMIIFGGRGHHTNCAPLPIEVFSTESTEVYQFPGITMNRQVSFIYQTDVFFYGGFNIKNQAQPLGTLFNISLEKIFNNSPLKSKLHINKIQSNTPNNKTKNLKTNNKKTNPLIKQQFKLSPDVVIGSGGIAQEGEEEQLMDDPSSYHKVSIDKLPEENKRIGEATNNNIASLLQNKHEYNKDLIEKFIQNLLRPFDWYDKQKMEEIHSTLPFSNEEILNLIKDVKPVLEKDHSLIKLRSPCKIFGNLYGVYNDLMRYFESYGNPSDDNQMGDINFMQYVFLGDFCDRGFNSLEIIFLLFALKIKYPDFIYLIRGHHEDIKINEQYGLGQECTERLRDDIKSPTSIFMEINKAFEYLPFGVLVDNSILLIHGGIGTSINTLDDIENIKRPISVEHNVTSTGQLNIIDLLWSEYSDTTNNVDINSERDEYKKGFIVKYGKERLNKFLDDNKINLLITSHQFVKEGFTTFNNDRILIVFSATNYMDKYANIGAMIIIAKKTANKRMNIIPKLINLYDMKQDCFRKDRNPSPIRISNNQK